MFEHDPLATLLLVLTGFQVVALAAAWLLLRRPRHANPGGCPAWLSRLAQRPRAAIALVFAVAFALSALLALVHWPVPRIQDEFSYRLAGETFAAGRLANPSHPLWQHFETEHVLQRPTYASKYPPMQGLSLAAGNLLTGDPLPGAWLGLAAACAAVCWMFYAFLPARWALLGGLLVASHPWILAWWGHSGWGGQMAMLGGALLYGSVRRIAGGAAGARPQPGHALLMGLGLAVLANSRPYEGFVAGLPAAAVMAWYLLGPRRPTLADAVARVIVPAGAILLLTAAAMTTYNHRVTGDPFTLPYQLHTRTYGATPMFLWQDLPPGPEHPERKLRDFYEGWERGIALDQQTAYGISRKLLHKAIQLGGFYFGPALGLALVGLVRRRTGQVPDEEAEPVPGRGWSSFIPIAAAITIAASFLCVWFNPHYVAPVAPLLLLLAVLGLRRLALAGGRAGRLAAAVTIAHGATTAALLIAAPIVYPNDDWSHARARMIADLTARGGKHLVLLRHGREYTPHEEWIYNAADIDASPVVWARELDSAAGRRIRDYYKNRTHWLLEAYRPPMPDGTPAPVPTLRPYPALPAWLESPPRVLLPGEAIATVGVADLDGDGVNELLVAPLGRPSLLIYRAAQWDSPSTIDLPAPALAIVAEEPSPGSPQRIAATLAGLPSLAVTGSAGGVSIIDLPAPGVALATVPGEGIIAVSCPAPAGIALVRWNGLPAATPWTPVGDEPHGIAAADLTGDGVPDIALCDRTGGAVWLVAGRRDGEAWAIDEPARIADVPEALGLAAADLDGDGRFDLAAASASRDEAVVLRRREDGSFERSALNTGIVPLAVVATDVDPDGLPDLAVATRWGHGLTVLRREADGGFAAPAEVTLGTQTWFVEKASRLAAGDLDGDGVNDIIVAAVSGVYVYLSRLP